MKEPLYALLNWCHIRCVDGDEGVEAAGVEVSVSSSNSLFLELIHRDPVVHWNGFLEPQSSFGCITQKCVHWKSICETWEKAAVAKIMINQMSRHLVRLVCLEFHLCVCWRRWCMLCLFSHGIGDRIHRQSSGGYSFEGVKGLSLSTTEMSTQPKHNMSIQSSVWDCTDTEQAMDE